jgi:acetyl-CoA carboxylase carboxyltransferase component
MNMNIEFNRNEDAMKLSLSEMRRRLDKIYEGGGKKAIEKQREKNKLTPKERIAYLVDNDNARMSGFALQGHDPKSKLYYKNLLVKVLPK